MTWHTGPLALFDLESTGVDPHRDRIVSAAVIEVIPGHDKREHEWLLNPGIDIPEGAARVHGITTEQAQASGAEPAGAIWEIADLLLKAVDAGACIVGHNVTYDLTMLWAELHRHGHRDQADRIAGVKPVIDTMVLDKQADPYRPKAPTARRKDPATCGSRTLIDTCRVNGVTLSEEDAHGAVADALAAGRLAWKLAQANKHFQIPALHLHENQMLWKREQADSFGDYLRKQGKPDDVSRTWPLQEPPTDWNPQQLPIAREVDAA